MELVFGITCLAVGIAGLIWVVRFGRRAADWLYVLGAGMQILVVALLFADWGHSWVETSGISIALDRFSWIAFPHMIALVTIAGTIVWGDRFRGWAGILSLIQTGLLIVVMLKAEQKVDLSFLAPVPLITMFVSAMSSFAFFGSSLVVLPDSRSFWYRFVFKPRENLVTEILALADAGIEVSPPRTVFECGSASGWMEGARVEVSTFPTLLPPRYGLQVRVSVQGTWHGHRLPGFATSERWLPRDGWVEYHGLTDRGFTLEKGGLARFIGELAGVPCACASGQVDR
ncbi:MAG TPA: hypothetical protein PLY68_05105 [Myxococcota bacterium]|nr:hypothetical protein [Myxococcota bacterium]HPB49796.1 hypothetical protein [Myxococcota bacterium]HQP95557.1 hypothetical protein [Myxococcota bacterium]